MGAICDVKAPPWSGEDITPFAEFLRAYAEYVLYRTTQFGPGFEELLVRGRSISFLTCDQTYIDCQMPMYCNDELILIASMGASFQRVSIKNGWVSKA